MLIPFLISKIHQATVTGADMNYQGSIAIDPDLMKEARLREFQKVDIYFQPMSLPG
jgi:aspartate 1-decarboxylase